MSDAYASTNKIIDKSVKILSIRQRGTYQEVEYIAIKLMENANYTAIAQRHNGVAEPDRRIGIRDGVSDSNNLVSSRRV